MPGYGQTVPGHGRVVAQPMPTFIESRFIAEVVKSLGKDHAYAVVVRCPRPLHDRYMTVT